MHSISSVEIFRIGKWNSDDYSAQDLEQMAEAFNRVGFQPPAKLGHAEDGCAVGRVHRIYRVGDKLLADFQDVPDEVYKIIQQRGNDACSAEIYWNLSRNVHTFPRSLKAVALLGPRRLPTESARDAPSDNISL